MYRSFHLLVQRSTLSLSLVKDISFSCSIPLFSCLTPPLSRLLKNKRLYSHRTLSLTPSFHHHALDLGPGRRQLSPPWPSPCLPGNTHCFTTLLTAITANSGNLILFERRKIFIRNIIFIICNYHWKFNLPREVRACCYSMKFLVFSFRR